MPTDIVISVQHVSLDAIDPSELRHAYPLAFKAIKGDIQAVQQLQHIGAYRTVATITMTAEVSADLLSSLIQACEVTTSGVFSSASSWRERQSLPQGVSVDAVPQNHSASDTSSGIGTLLICSGHTYIRLVQGFGEMTENGVSMVTAQATRKSYEP